MNFKELMSILDWDQRLVSFEFYEQNYHLYSKVIDKVCVLAWRKPCGGLSLDFISEVKVGGVLERKGDVRVTDTLLLVQLRNAGFPSNFDGELIDEYELEKNRDSYKILDIYFVATPKHPPFIPIVVSMNTYIKFKEEYDIVDNRYCVVKVPPFLRRSRNVKIQRG